MCRPASPNSNRSSIGELEVRASYGNPELVCFEAEGFSRATRKIRRMPKSDLGAFDSKRLSYGIRMDIFRLGEYNDEIGHRERRPVIHRPPLVAAHRVFLA